MNQDDTTFIALCIYAVQIPLSSFWLKRFRMGPMEWLWRLLTYGKKDAHQKISKSQSTYEARQMSMN
ncbi:DUF418 domain-containing protein [Paenibacillus sp. OAE614]|uniref:DUF418 domain-containing protein n=1 Tax=Paenibacillus sp. OAE614 TaxID=2663804 RepID=UPI001788F5EC